LSGSLPDGVFRKLAAFRKEHVEKATKVATRKASQMALEVINGDRADDRRLGRSDRTPT
jgi:transketolase